MMLCAAMQNEVILLENKDQSRIKRNEIQIENFNLLEVFHLQIYFLPR